MQIPLRPPLFDLGSVILAWMQLEMLHLLHPHDRWRINLSYPHRHRGRRHRLSLIRSFAFPRLASNRKAIIQHDQGAFAPHSTVSWSDVAASTDLVDEEE